MRFEKGPEEFQYIQSLEKALAALEKLPLEEREKVLGRHPGESYLRGYAEGSLPAPPGRTESLHLSFCDSCAKAAIHLEYKHLERLREEAKVEARYDLASTGTEESLPLLKCRSFDLELEKKRGAPVFAFGVDDPSEIDDVEVCDAESGARVSYRKEEGAGRLYVRPTESGQYAGRRIRISFRHEDSSWSKTILFT